MRLRDRAPPPHPRLVDAIAVLGVEIGDGVFGSGCEVQSSESRNVVVVED